MKKIYHPEKYRKCTAAVLIFCALCAVFTVCFTSLFSVLAAENGQTDDPAQEQTDGTQTEDTESEGETVEGVRIPREIVLGIFAAAVIGGGAAGYWFARKRK